MNELSIELIVTIIISILWLISSIVLTLKVLRQDDLEKGLKRKLIVPMWLVPIAGALVCYIFFTKIRGRRYLSSDEVNHIGLFGGGR